MRKSNLKKKKLNKKQIIIIIVIALILLFISALIARMLTKDVNDNMLEAENTISIEEIVKKNGCEYISDNKSELEGFDIDIYLTFGKDTIVDGVSQEAYYNSVFNSLAIGLEYKNLRLIDSSRGLEVKIKCSKDGYISSILINDDENFFERLISDNSKTDELKVKEVSMDVTSPELNALISNSWVTGKVKLGSKESTYNKYDIYFDEGIEVRTIKKKVYNIVFTNKYTKNVVGTYRVNADLDTIKARYGDSRYEDTGIVGYKTKDFYIFFLGDSISVYPNYSYVQKDYEEFEKLVKEYNEKKDLNDFMDKLTDVWPDYDKYNYDTNFLEICYTLKGVRIAYSSENSEGIQLYENYNGSLRNEKEDLGEVYLKLDENLMLKNEIERLVVRNTMPSDYDLDELQRSENFLVEYTMIDKERKGNLSVKSKNGQYPNNTLDDTIIINTYYWIDDNNLLYNIQGKGIYLYNAITRKTQTLLEGEDETYNITSYDKNTKVLKYDGKSVLIKY